MTESLAVVIVTRNSASTVARALDSMRGETVILVDNDSSDATLERAREVAHENLEIIANRSNHGFGAAANQAAGRVSAPFLIFMNPDAWCSEDLPARLMGCLENGDEWAVGPRLLDAEGDCDHAARRFPEVENAFYNRRWVNRGGSLTNEAVRRFLMTDRDHAARFECDWVSGALFMARTDLFREIGGFDESFFLFYEDVDLFRRAAERGWKTLYAGDLVGHHTGAVSTRQAFAGAGFSLLRSFVRYYAKWLRTGLESDARMLYFLTRSLTGDMARRLGFREANIERCG